MSVCTCVDTRLFYSPPTKSQSMRLGFDRFTFTNQSMSNMHACMQWQFCSANNIHFIGVGLQIQNNSEYGVVYNPGGRYMLTFLLDSPTLECKS